MSTARFDATLQQPATPGDDAGWLFLVLPRDASDTLPRRGRTSVTGHLNGQAFQATLEPDGQLSHWLKVDAKLQQAAGVAVDDHVTLEIAAMHPEPEPEVPADLARALDAAPDARAMWDDTTTLARLDWIHWIESAKQAGTRAKRVAGACDRLASGKRRVCCFDPSGHYSKAFKPPKAAD